MNEDLKQRIKEFNDIKYPKDNETRIIIATLKPSNGYTWKQEADDMIEEYNQGTVTTAPK
tara:strand:+ start:44 stop:223 length:180 start_codon:yes stop_codon:yes gene_type:complete